MRLLGKERNLSESGAWTSLEITRLAVSALTPIVVAFLTLAITRATKQAERREAEAAKRAEQAEWVNRRAIERLLELHARMAPLMNDLMCFFRTIGHFRDIDPPTAITKKRELDKLYFVNEQIFDPAFRARYQEFMHECFEHWKSPGEDAKIKASASWLKSERGVRGWNEDWNRLFTKEPHDGRALRHLQREKYNQAMEAFAAQLGLGASEGRR